MSCLLQLCHILELYSHLLNSIIKGFPVFKMNTPCYSILVHILQELIPKRFFLLTFWVHYVSQHLILTKLKKLG